MAFIITYAGSNGLFEEVTKIIKGEKRESKSPPTPEFIPPSPSPTDSPPKSEKGDSNSLYFSPAKEGTEGEYMDLYKTLNSNTHKRLRDLNGGLSPIKLYEDPSGNNQGKSFGKIIGKNGKRNIYEANPEFTNNWLTNWSYTGKNGFTQSATINKNWLPIMNQMAQFLESENLWNKNAIKSWDCGILRRDVNPKDGIKYGLLSSHAYGMAVDINAVTYPLTPKGMADYKKDLQDRKPTAKVIDKLKNKFNGKIFWAGTSGDPHHFSVKISV